jgi:hypothetical protein
VREPGPQGTPTALFASAPQVDLSGGDSYDNPGLTSVRAYLDSLAERHKFVELLIQERAQFKDRASPTYFVHRETRVERRLELYLPPIAKGRDRAMPVGRITDVASAAVCGAMPLQDFGGRSETFAASAEDILDVPFHGIPGGAGR